MNWYKVETIVFSMLLSLSCSNAMANESNSHAKTIGVTCHYQNKTIQGVGCKIGNPLADMDGLDNSFYPTHSLSNNTITLKSGKITGSVLGAVTANKDQTVKGNTVFIKGGEMVGVSGGMSEAGLSTGNQVIIDGEAKITGAIFGGDSTMGNSLGNSVIIRGGDMADQAIIGGYSHNGNATGNSVIFEGNAPLNLGTESAIIGGTSDSEYANGDFFTENKLILKRNISVNEVSSFAHYEFVLSPMLASAPILKVDNLYLTDDLEAGKLPLLTLRIEGNPKEFKAGSVFVLINATNVIEGSFSNARHGAILKTGELQFKINLDDKKITATIME